MIYLGFIYRFSLFAVQSQPLCIFITLIIKHKINNKFNLKS